MQLIKETYSKVHTQTEQCQPRSIFIALRNFTAQKEPQAVTQMKWNKKDADTNHMYLLHIVQVLITNMQNAAEHLKALWLLHQTLKKLHLGILCNTWNEYQSS